MNPHIDMKMKSCMLVILAVIMTVFPAYSAQPSAASSLKKMASVMKGHPSMEVVFTVWNNGNSSTGSLTVADEKFHLATPEMKIWFDGLTQWTYVPSAKEVNITEPTQSELAQANPLSILSNLERDFSFRRVSTNAGKEKISLTPKKKNREMSSVILTLDTSTSLPQELQIKDEKGHLTTIKISSIKWGKKLPAGVFRYAPAKFPGVEVIDLR